MIFLPSFKTFSFDYYASFHIRFIIVLIFRMGWYFCYRKESNIKKGVIANKGAIAKR